MTKIVFLLLLSVTALAQKAVYQQANNPSTFLRITPGAGGSTGLFSPMNSSSNVPMLYYYHGTYERTYITWVKGPNRSREGMICYYDHTTRTFSADYSLGVISSGQSDQHQSPTIIVSNDGYIITAEEDGHQTGIRIKRSTNPEDITAFTLITVVGSTSAPNTDITSSFGYPNFVKAANGDIYLHLRDKYHLNTYFKTTDKGTTWATRQPIIEASYAGYSQPPDATIYNTLWRNYSRIIQRGSVYYVITNMLEFNTGTTANLGRSIGVMKTTDMATFSNMAGTFSKNVVSNGAVTREQWDADCLVYGTGSGLTDWVWNIAATVDASGNLYLLSRAIGSGYIFHYFYGGVWTSKSAPFLDVVISPLTANQDSATLFVRASGAIDAWVEESVGGVHQVMQYQTLDLGTTWTLVKNASLSATTTQRYSLGTSNYWDSPEPLMISGFAPNSLESNMLINRFIP